jgi:hypothetical protein
VRLFTTENEIVKSQCKDVVIDSSSVILLFKAGLLNEIVTYYRICMAESVYDELTMDDHAGSKDVQALLQQNRISIIPFSIDNISNDDPRGALLSLDRGECDTIHLYLQGQGEFVILDDGKGASYCRNNGIPYINALLVPRIIYFSGNLSAGACDDYMNRIIGFGRYSKKIIEFARVCSGEQMSRFM